MPETIIAGPSGLLGDIFNSLTQVRLGSDQITVKQVSLGRDRGTVQEIWNHALVITGHIANISAVALLIAAAVRRCFADSSGQGNRPSDHQISVEVDHQISVEKVSMTIQDPAGNEQELTFTAEASETHISKVIASAMRPQGEQQ